MSRMIRQLLADESGMETVEWGVIAALIVGAVVTALTTLGTNVKRQFDIMVNATK
jgi:Flp pilus assembly pilin Flp